jgi:hypothetical protein
MHTYIHTIHIIHTHTGHHRRGNADVVYIHMYIQKRPTTVSKETYYSVKRDLLQCHRRGNADVVYIHMYIYACIYICMYVQIYVRIYVHIYIRQARKVS